VSQWTEGSCQANGIEIHYLRTGGDKPPIVLLHGFTDDGACWGPLARALEKDWDVIMPDARGHGRSSVPQAPYGIKDLAQDVIGLIEALKLERPVVGGHSMGGITAAVAAAERPDLVRALVLEDPGFVARDSAMGDEQKVAERRRRMLEGHKSVLATPIEELMASRRKESPHWSEETVELWARSKYLTKVEAFTMLGHLFPDYRDVVRAIQCPSLVIMGEAELGGIVTAEMAGIIHDLNPHFRCEKVAGAGHCVRYDRPEEYTELVLAYLWELA